MTDVVATPTPARRLGDAASVWAPSDNPDGKKSRRVSWQVEPCFTPGKACNAPIPGQCQDLKICCPSVPGSLSPAWRTSAALQPCPGDGGGSPAQFRPQGEMGELDTSFSSIETVWSLPSVDDRERQVSDRQIVGFAIGVDSFAGCPTGSYRVSWPSPDVWRKLALELWSFGASPARKLTRLGSALAPHVHISYRSIFRVRSWGEIYMCVYVLGPRPM